MRRSKYPPSLHCSACAMLPALKALGNGVVPHQAYAIAACILAAEGLPMPPQAVNPVTSGKTAIPGRPRAPHLNDNNVILFDINNILKYIYNALSLEYIWINESG